MMLFGQCGDPLVRVPLIRPTQIFAMLVAGSFIAPLLSLVIAFVQDDKQSALRRLLTPTVIIIVLVNE